MSLMKDLLDLDVKILKFFYNPYYLDFTNFFLFLIFSIYILFTSTTYYYYRKKKYRKTIHLVLAAFSGYLLVAFLKLTVGRPRPYASVPGIVSGIIKSDPSFPSAHSFLSIFMFSFIPPKLPRWLKLLLSAYLISIPIANMVIGVHFPSDVLVGGILGIIWPRIMNERISSKIFNKIVKKLGW